VKAASLESDYQINLQYIAIQKIQAKPQHIVFSVRHQIHLKAQSVVVDAYKPLKINNIMVLIGLKVL